MMVNALDAVDERDDRGYRHDGEPTVPTDVHAAKQIYRDHYQRHRQHSADGDFRYVHLKQCFASSYDNFPFHITIIAHGTKIVNIIIIIG